MEVSITAIILAAGQSKRMGQPKMLLPWGNMTVLGQVLSTLRDAGLTESLVITGAEREAVERIAQSFGATTVHNVDFEKGEMLSSLQAGIRALIQAPPRPSPNPPGASENLKGSPSADLERVPAKQEGALICLGDQPQVEARTVRGVASRFIEGESQLVVPSHNMRRGHPWLVARPLWDEILALRAPKSPRDFLAEHAEQINYFAAGSNSILADLDSPNDYLRSRPTGEK